MTLSDLETKKVSAY